MQFSVRIYQMESYEERYGEMDSMAKVHTKYIRTKKQKNIIEQDHVGMCVGGLTLFPSHHTQTQPHAPPPLPPAPVPSVTFL